MTNPPAPPYVGPAYHVSKGANKPIDRIVIHCTVSECKVGGAREIGHYFQSPTSGGSAQYVVDPGEVVQSVYDGEIAQHAPPNQHSIGVELCDAMKGGRKRWSDPEHDAMLHLAAQLVADLCKAYGVPIKKRNAVGLRLGRKGICGHVDVSHAFHQSTHWDPGPAFPWRRFMRMVQDAADGKEYVTLRNGESLSDVAARGGISVARLWRLNRDIPAVGAKLRVK